jgi:excisionase family DNA binding protein
VFSLRSMANEAAFHCASRFCWAGSRIGLTFWRPARNRTASSERRRSGIGRRIRRYMKRLSGRPEIPTNAVTLDGARLLTIEPVSEMLQVPVSCVREHVRANASDRIPGLKLGKYWRFRSEDVLGWLAARKV